METPPSPSHVVIAYDATKERTEHELNLTINRVRLRGDILRTGDTLVVFGVLHRVTHPSECFFMDCFAPCMQTVYVCNGCVLIRAFMIQYLY